MEAVKRLMCAILEDALRCFERNHTARTPVRRREFREAENWLFRESAGEGLFSFKNVCHALGVDSNRLRRAMSKRRANALAGETPKPLFRRSPVVRKSSTGAVFAMKASKSAATLSGC
jgi:hypothetical protein